jgi:hypothetical protein
LNIIASHTFLANYRTVIAGDFFALEVTCTILIVVTAFKREIITALLIFPLEKLLPRLVGRSRLGLEFQVLFKELLG